MSFRDRLLKKIIRCPNCSQKLRIPVRRGKRLRITCASCRVQFDIAFQNPLSELFQWYSGRGLRYNFKSFFLRLKVLPLRWFIFLFLIFSLVFYSLSSVRSGPKVSPAINEQYDEIVI